MLDNEFFETCKAALGIAGINSSRDEMAKIKDALRTLAWLKLAVTDIQNANGHDIEKIAGLKEFYDLVPKKES